MPGVTVTVPGLLARFTGERRTVPVEADTVAGAIEGLVESHPALAPHLFDGHGGLRAHLKLYLNGTGVDWEEGAAVELEARDEVLVLQAVSGG